MEDTASWVLVSRMWSPYKKALIEKWRGLSRDMDKLPCTGDTGSTAYCIDTGEEYMFEKTTGAWYSVPNQNGSGGGGGEGGSGTVPVIPIATDREVAEMLDTVFGEKSDENGSGTVPDASVATDREVTEMLDAVFGAKNQ